MILPEKCERFLSSPPPHTPLFFSKSTPLPLFYLFIFLFLFFFGGRRQSPQTCHLSPLNNAIVTKSILWTTVCVKVKTMQSITLDRIRIHLQHTTCNIAFPAALGPLLKVTETAPDKSRKFKHGYHISSVQNSETTSVSKTKQGHYQRQKPFKKKSSASPRKLKRF